jgi:hypothetical protein
MKRIKYNSTTMLSICIILLGFLIYKLIKRESQYTHVEKVIKKHNGIKESTEDLYYPTASKPANSQIGMFAGDSVKVINH